MFQCTPLSHSAQHVLALSHFLWHTVVPHWDLPIEDFVALPDVFFPLFILVATQMADFCVTPLRVCCRCGSFSMVKWLCTHRSYDSHEQMAAFIGACYSSNMELVKFIAHHFYLLSLRATDSFENVMRCAISTCCRKGDLGMAKCVTEHFDLNSSHIRTSQCDIDIPHLNVWLSRRGDLLQYPIITACLYGKLELLQWLSEKFQLSLDDFHNSRALACLCASAHLLEAKWLAKTYAYTSELARSEFVFEAAVDFGNRNIWKWVILNFGLTKEDVRFDF